MIERTVTPAQRLWNIISEVCVVGILVGCGILIRHLSQEPARQTTSTPRAVPIASQVPADKPQPKITVSYATPARLKIPKISVDAGIELVGLASDGTMQSPGVPQNIGWYKYGPPLGYSGSAVVAGHFGRSRSGDGSAFDNLHQLVRGDTVSVEDQKGIAITYAVRELRVYRFNETVPDVFRSADGQAHLNLITCQGKWDVAKKTYSHRLVVFADKL